jgi:SAM-dependent methyltransferase
MNVISKIFLVIFLFSVANAASSAEEPQHVKDLRTYVGFVSPGSGIDAIPENFTAKNAFTELCMVWLGIEEVAHDSEKPYGKSFTDKNEKPIEFTAELLTGCGSWGKDAIEGTCTNIADVGCGLGLSALSLIAMVSHGYEEDGWHLDHPIQFDLYDINPTHQPALKALARIVNAAYPEYFHVTADCGDITNSFEIDYYDVILALNVMHYIPEGSWHLALENIENAMKNSSYLLMTVDSVSRHVSADVRRNSVFFPSCLSFFPVGSTVGDSTATVVRTDGSSDYLAKSYIPGETYTKDDVHVEKLVRMLSVLGHEHLHLVVNGERQIVVMNQIKEHFDKNVIQIYAGNYSFDADSLKEAVTLKLKSTTELQIGELGWETYDERNASISLKKVALKNTADSLSSSLARVL